MRFWKRRHGNCPDCEKYNLITLCYYIAETSPDVATLMRQSTCPKCGYLISEFV